MKTTQVLIINKKNKNLLYNEINSEDGLLFLVNKPKNWTSFDVVKKIRNTFKLKKVGHSGTLDPTAEGLMIIATNKKTKQLQNFSELDKEYYGKMIIGAKTPSFDAETEIIEKNDYTYVKKEFLEEVFKKFIGTITQKPPIYSAVKYHGKPLYKYARKGKKLDLIERPVIVKNLELLEFSPPEVKFRVECSKGTYIRSLVNDIGIALGCGAYLIELVRTKIGSFLLEEALNLDDLIINKCVVNEVS